MQVQEYQQKTFCRQHARGPESHRETRMHPVELCPPVQCLTSKFLPLHFRFLASPASWGGRNRGCCCPLPDIATESDTFPLSPGGDAVLPQENQANSHSTVSQVGVEQLRERLGVSRSITNCGQITPPFCASVSPPVKKKIIKNKKERKEKATPQPNKKNLNRTVALHLQKGL